MKMMQPSLLRVILLLLSCASIAPAQSQPAFSGSDIRAAVSRYPSRTTSLDFIIQAFRATHPSANIDSIKLEIRSDGEETKWMELSKKNYATYYYKIHYQQLGSPETLSATVRRTKSDEVSFISNNILRFEVEEAHTEDSGVVLNGKQSDTRYYFREATKLYIKEATNLKKNYTLIVVNSRN